jgi:hypothetical protein
VIVSGRETLFCWYLILISSLFSLSLSHCYYRREDKPGGTKHLMRSHEPLVRQEQLPFRAQVPLTDDNNDAVLTRFVVGVSHSFGVYDPTRWKATSKLPKRISRLDGQSVKSTTVEKTLTPTNSIRFHRSHVSGQLPAQSAHALCGPRITGQQHWATSRNTVCRGTTEEELDAIFTHGTKPSWVRMIPVIYKVVPRPTKQAFLTW